MVELIVMKVGGFMVTLKDVAELAGVSTTTVSRILNRDLSFSVKEDTRNRVVQAAEELGYRTKKNILNGESKRKRFGIVQWISSYEEEQDAYYLNLRQAVENYCIQHKIAVDRYFMENILEVYENDDLDGLICIGKFSLAMVHELAEHSPNILFVDSNPDGSRYSSIMHDLKDGTQLIVDYLKEMGHEHIGYIAGEEYLGLSGKINVDIREKTFKKIIRKDQQIRTDPKDIYIDTFTYQTGYQSIMKAYDKKDMPTAFICGSDAIAMGALSALGELNEKLSQKISIISYNNIQSAQYMNPPLTTLALNTKYMGELAGNLLQHMVDSNHTTPVKVLCGTHLVIRESVYKN